MSTNKDSIRVRVDIVMFMVVSLNQSSILLRRDDLTPDLT